MMMALDSAQQAQALEEGHKRGTTNPGDRMLCVIRLGDHSLALRTSLVQEVIGNAVLVTVPLAPAFLAGLVTHRGVMLSIVSLRSVLGLPPAEGKNCVVVLRADAAGGECFGLLVDQVLGVLTLEDQMLKKIPPTVSAYAQDVFRGMYVRDDGPLVELNVDHLRSEWLSTNANSSKERVEER